MPIQINSAQFTDNFGNTNGFYKGNVGDKFSVDIEVTSLIYITSVANPLTLDTFTNQVTSPNTSWLEEGFRVGDPCRVRIHQSGGAIIHDNVTTITYVDDILCDFSAMPFWYNITNGQYVTIIALDPLIPTNVKPRADLDVLLNHVKNNIAGSEYSLIDGEVSRAVFLGVESMIVGASINGVLTNLQSGQFLIDATITRNAQIGL